MALTFICLFYSHVYIIKTIIIIVLSAGMNEMSETHEEDQGEIVIPQSEPSYCQIVKIWFRQRFHKYFQNRIANNIRKLQRKQKNRCICAFVAMFIFFLFSLIIGMVYFARREQLENSQNRRDAIKQKKGQIQIQIKESLMNRSYNMSHLSLCNLNLEEARNTSFLNQPTIKLLNIENNQVEELNRIVLHNLQTMILDRNPTKSIVNCELPVVTNFSTKYTHQIKQITNNTLKSIKELDFTQHLNLQFFCYNNLQSAQKLILPSSLLLLNGNDLRNLQGFSLKQLKNLKQIVNNTIKIRSIEIDDSRLCLFQNNTFLQNKQMILYSTNLTKLNIQNMADLTQLIIQSDNPIGTLTLISNPKLTNLTSRNGKLNNLIIDGCNIFLNFQPNNFNSSSLLQLKLSNIHALKYWNLKEMWKLESLEIINATLEQISLQKQTKIQNLHIQSTSLCNLSDYNFKKLKNMRLQNNKELKHLKNNNFSLVQDLFISGSCLSGYQKNIDGRIQKLELISTTGTQQFLRNINKSKIERLILIQNDIYSCKFSDFENLIDIHIENNPIKQIQLTNLQNLTSISLNLTNLQSLKIQGITIINFASLLLPSLKHLQFENVFIQQFSNLKLDNLESLVIKNTSIKNFQKNFLTSLKKIIVIDSTIEVLEIDKNNSLVELRFINSNLQSISQKDILNNLQLLQITKNKYLKSFLNPKIPNLKHLILYENPQLTKIEISNTSLKQFNNISTFAKTLTFINNSQMTQFSHNSLFEVQDINIYGSTIIDCKNNTFDKLKNLKFMNTKYNLIPFIKEFLDSFSIVNNMGLTELLIPPQYSSINYFEINDPFLQNILIHDCGSLNHLVVQGLSLKNIEICNSNLSEITIYKGDNIESIYFQNTSLTNFTGWNLPTVKQLILKQNKITQLVSNNFPQLIILQLEGNLLNKIVFSERLHNLEYLVVTNTTISSLTGTYLYPNVVILKLENNFLTEFDFVNAQKLRSFILQQSNLISLTFDNIGALKQFYFESANIKDLVIKNNKKLFCLENYDFPRLLSMTIQNNLLLFFIKTSTPSLLNLTIDSLDFSKFGDGFILSNITSLNLKDVKITNIAALLEQYFVSVQSLVLEHIDNLYLSIENISLKKLVCKFSERKPLKYLVIKNVSSNLNSLQAFNVQDIQIANLQSTSLNIIEQNLYSLKMKNIILQKFQFYSPTVRKFEYECENTIHLNVSIPSLEEGQIKTPNVHKLMLLGSFNQISFEMPQIEILILRNTSISQLFLQSCQNLEKLIVETDQYLCFVLQNNNKVDLNQFKTPGFSSLIINNTNLATMPKCDYSQASVLKLIDPGYIQSNPIKIVNMKKISQLVLKNVSISEIILENNSNIQHLQIRELSQLEVVKMKDLRSSEFFIQLNSTNIREFKIVNTTTVNRIYNFNKLESVFIENSNILAVYAVESNNLSSVQIFDVGDFGSISLDMDRIQSLHLSTKNIKYLQIKNLNMSIFQNSFLVLRILKIENMSAKEFPLHLFPLLEELQLKNAPFMEQISINHENLQVLILHNLNLNKFELNNINQLNNLQLRGVKFTSQIQRLYAYSLINITLENTSFASLFTFQMPNIQHISVYNNPLTNIVNCSWTKLTLLSVYDSEIQSFGDGCDFSTLLQLQLVNTMAKSLNIQSATKLNHLVLLNIGISSFNDNFCKNLSVLKIGGPNLLQIKINYSDSLTVVEVTNSQKLFKFQIGEELPQLNKLVIKDSNVPITLNLEKYKNIKTLIIMNTNITKILLNSDLQQLVIVDYDYNQRDEKEFLDMKNMSCKSLTKLSLLLKIFSISNLECPILNQFVIEPGSTIKQITNISFPIVPRIDISNVTVYKFVNNSFLNVSNIQINSCKLQQFHHNYFPKTRFVNLQDNQISQFKQSFPLAVDINLNKNYLTQISNLHQYAPILYKLSVAGNLIRDLPNFQSDILRFLNLRGNKLTIVHNWQMKILQNLDVSNNLLKNMYNNYFPKMKYVEIRQNSNLSQFQLLSFLSTQKGQGNDFKALDLKDIDVDVNVQSAIVLLYPDIVIKNGYNSTPLKIPSDDI